MREFKKGFTLAEVLITLLIIGVIASIVVPGIISNTNEAEHTAGLKKTYADLSNAIKMIQANNGGSVNFGDLRGDFCSVMSCIKIDTNVNTFGSATNYKWYKGGNLTSWAGNSDSNPSAVLNNGSFVTFITGDYPACGGYGVNECGWIYTDLNGKKGPNMFGKDLNRFWISRPNLNGPYIILPFGTQGDNYAPLTSCTAGSITNGTSEGCTAWRLTKPDSMPQ